MDNIPRYIACKHGEEPPDYLHPTLEGILKETFGIMIYQEQVIQIAQVLSGYSQGGADLRPGRQVRGLWLQQEPRRGLCPRRLPDGVAQGQLPGRVLRRVDDA